MIYLIELSDKRNIIMYNRLRSSANVEAFTFSDDAPKAYQNAAVIFSPGRKLNANEASMLPYASKVFGGKQSPDVLTLLQERGITYFNILENENYAIKNAKLTAEGALSLVISGTGKSVLDNNVLILGCGRVGKAAAILLGKIGTKVSIATFNKTEFEAYSLYAQKAYFKYDFVRELDKYDVILNTIPKLILDDSVLEKIAPETALIELASVNCLDKESCGKYEFKYIPAPSLPAIYSPDSAAEIMLECILSLGNG